MKIDVFSTPKATIKGIIEGAIAGRSYSHWRLVFVAIVAIIVAILWRL